MLRTVKDVKAFCSRIHFSMGAGVSAAAGPIGRAAEADIRAGDRGAATCYTYSCSKGEKKVAKKKLFYCCIFVFSIERSSESFKVGFEATTLF